MTVANKWDDKFNGKIKCTNDEEKKQLTAFLTF